MLGHLPFSTHSVPNPASSEAVTADSFPVSPGGLGSCVALVWSCHCHCAACRSPARERNLRADLQI